MRLIGQLWKLSKKMAKENLRDECWMDSMSLFSVCIPKTSSFAQHHRPTKRALDAGILRDLQAFFWLRVFFCSQAESTPAPAPVTQTVETVEKVPFQKLIFGKWD